jgi:ABC-2 type transport system ATP-binding protein
MKSIEVNNLTKTFKEGKNKVNAVDNISFSVNKGEIFGLLGVNGAGKTTTINMLTGLLKKDSGIIKILGKDPDIDWEYVKNRIGVSTAYFSLSEVLTIRENLKVFAKIYDVNDYEKKINWLLESFELTSLADKQVIDLSSGEKTRAVLCKGLISSPEILFLDECTVGLDPDIAEKTRRIIKEYHKKTGCTIIFTSHYMFEVEELCERIAFMEKGKIVTIATAKELKKTINKNTIELTLKKDAKLLKEFLESEKIKVTYWDNNSIAFDITIDNYEVHDILKKVFDKGFRISDIHIKKPTLDDFFIHFARRKK